MNQISWLSRQIHIIECQSVLHDHTSIEYCFGPSSQLLVGIQCPKYALVLYVWMILVSINLPESTSMHTQTAVETTKRIKLYVPSPLDINRQKRVGCR